MHRLGFDKRGVASVGISKRSLVYGSFLHMGLGPAQDIIVQAILRAIVVVGGTWPWKTGGSDQRHGSICTSIDYLHDSRFSHDLKG